MTTRNDVNVDFSDSPRVAEVEAPSLEFNAQDIVDTLRVAEESFRGQSEKKLLNASGKESLGGGVQVGTTVELQNTEIAFQRRTDPAIDSTITTTTSAAVAERQYLIDSAGNFTSNADIHRGAFVINWTDGSISEIRRIVDDSTLETKPLVNGTDNLYEAGDDYQIFKVYQCEVLGGNVVAVDGNGNEASPILPTAFTQVIRTASSSATTQNLAALEFASYNNGVTIDVVNGVAGTEYPIGTGLSPVNNLADAFAIADDRGLQFIYVVGSLTITSGQNWTSGFIFKGTSPTTSVITVNPAALLDNCEIWDAYVTGTVDSSFIIRNCIVGPVSIENGFIWESSIIGPITLTGGETHIINCWSQVPGASSPEIDFNGSGQSLGLRNYTGGILLKNKTGPESVSCDIQSGHVRLDSTVTNGTIVIRGVGKLTDNSTGTTDVQADDYLRASVVNDGIQRTTYLGSEGHGTVIDSVNGTDGVDYPIGTRQDPALTLQNAIDINTSRGFRRIYVVNSLVVDQHINDFIFIGDDPTQTLITLQPGGSPAGGSPLNDANCQYHNALVTGVAPNASSIFRDCLISDVSNVSGFIYNCAVQDTITVSGNTSMEECWISTGATNQELTIDFDNNPVTVIVSDWSAGRVRAINMVTGSFLGMAGSGGRVVIDQQNTGGTVVYGGAIAIDDTYAGNVDLVRNTSVAGQVWNTPLSSYTGGSPAIATMGDVMVNVNSSVDVIEVTVSNFSSVIDDLIKYQRNRSLIDETNFTLTIFDDDGTTPLTIFDLKDENGVASVTSIFERIPR